MRPENSKDCENEGKENADVEQTGQGGEQGLNQGFHAGE